MGALWQHRPLPWTGSIYLCLLCPVQRSGFIAWVLGVNLAGIHLEDGLGTPGKNNEMKGWVAAVLTQDFHSHQHLPPAQALSGNSSATAGSLQHLQIPQLQFCFVLFRKEGYNRKHASSTTFGGSRRTPSQFQAVEQYLRASPRQEYGISGNSQDLRGNSSLLLSLSLHGNMGIKLK